MYNPDLCPLFKHIPKDALDEVCLCLHTYEKQYQKNEAILHTGDEILAVGIVMKGCVHIMKQDLSGNQIMMASLSINHMLGEAFAFARVRLEVDIIASQSTTILWIPVSNLIHTSLERCPYYDQLIQNMLTIMANKNLYLSTKIEHLSKRTMKDKVLSYLIQQAKDANSSTFDIPFNRQELADYLCVDRSALSYVLAQLQKEGLILYHKNSFTLC
ncbi:MAG: Crp/Fnr family transcriptional regulator [Longicatena sp.]